MPGLFLMIVLQGAPGPRGPIERLVRIAGGPGVRDNPAARLTRWLHVESRLSLREALRSTALSSFGPALAGLSGARLFDDAGRIRQEVSIATIPGFE